MIENTIEYKNGELPEEVHELLQKATSGDGVSEENRQNKDIYAIVEQTEGEESPVGAVYITLGYFLPDEARFLESDLMFSQEFRIRISDPLDEPCEQIMYHSEPINLSDRISQGARFVKIDPETYRDFYEALKRDGLFDWKAVEERVLVSESH